MEWVDKSGKSLTGLIATLLMFTGYSAQAVELISDDRIVTTFNDNGSTQTVPDAPFAAFSVPRQSSTVSSTEFSGTGSGYGESDFFFFIAESKFDVTFEATTSTDIELSGFLTAFGGDFGYANVRVRLFAGADMSTLIFSDNIDADFEYNEGSVQFSGTLEPGVYRLILQTDITPGGFDTTGTWDFTASFTPGIADSDNDGVADDIDNCLTVANSDQRDTNDDGFGNACDPDLDNNGVVNFSDVSQWVPFFNTATTGDADFNGDGVANFADYALFADYFLQPPGPGAITP